MEKLKIFFILTFSFLCISFSYSSDSLKIIGQNSFADYDSIIFEIITNSAASCFLEEDFPFLTTDGLNHIFVIEKNELPYFSSGFCKNDFNLKEDFSIQSNFNLSEDISFTDELTVNNQAKILKKELSSFNVDKENLQLGSYFLNLDKFDSYCRPSFSKTFWSKCSNTFQFRIREDSYGCFNDIQQKRFCENSFSEIDNLYLNIKTIELIKVKENIYESNFLTGLYLIFLKNDYGDSFIIFNQAEKLDYLALKVDSNSSGFIYSLTEVDEQVYDSTILYDQKILKKTFSQKFEDFRKSEVYLTVSKVIIILISSSLLIFIIFSLKYNYKKKFSKNANIARFGDLERYSKYFNQIDSYIKNNPNLNNTLIKKNLESAGWDSKIIDLYFETKFK